MRFILIAFILGAAAPAAAAVSLTVPPDLTSPHPAAIHLHGLVPGTMVTLTSTRLDHAGGTPQVARARFISDARGGIDTATMAPVDGSYSGVEPLGLFWSAKAATGASVMATTPVAGQVEITTDVAGGRVASANASIAPDPDKLVVASDTPFPGAVYAHPARLGRYPVIIILGGSEGGSSTAKALAPVFAARGYAVLGLPYYNPGYDPTDKTPGLPTTFTDIPVDRLVAVREWLSRQPSVDVTRLGLWGASKGAEFALIAATHYPWIKAVAAIVPSDLVWEGWGRPGLATASFSFDGKPLPFQPYSGMDAELAKAARGEPMDIRRVHISGRAAFPDRIAAARIPIETYHGALLIAGSGRDKIWPSLEMTRNIGKSRERVGLSTEVLTFPDAGHFLGGAGTSPTAELTSAGGDPVVIAHARTAVWAATFDMFDRVLKPK